MTTMLNLQHVLGLRVPPIAIGFLDAPPAGLAAWGGGEKAAGCAFWKEAQDGQAFYTRITDHYNCAVGAYTHGIELPASRAGEMETTLGLMVENDYIKMEEVAGIPHLSKAPAIVAFGPVEAEAFPPDVVLIATNPVKAMLVYEAAVRAGVGSAVTSLIGRPTCALLPLTMENGGAAMSLACAGNRAYTGLGEDEFYVSIPGSRWPEFRERLAEIISANERMSEYYQEKDDRFNPQPSRTQ